MCFVCFFGKKHAAFKWKSAISGFPISPGSAEALVRWGWNIKCVLTTYFLGNICAKNYHNRTVYVKIIASQRWDVFETQCISSQLRQIQTHLGNWTRNVIKVIENYQYNWYPSFMKLRNEMFCSTVLLRHIKTKKMFNKLKRTGDRQIVVVYS